MTQTDPDAERRRQALVEHDRRLRKTTACPDCHATKGDVCRTASFRPRHRLCAGRVALGEALLCEELARTLGLSTTVPTPRLSAWDAGRQFDHDEAEALREWLRTCGEILWTR